MEGIMRFDRIAGKMKSVTPHIALLRGINVGGRNRIPMAELRALAASLGWKEVRTYIQSGNLIFAADGPAAKLEAELEAAIARDFGLAIPVLVRSVAEWNAYAGDDPFPEAVSTEPHLVMLALSKRALAEGAEDALRARAADGEVIVRAGVALWVHFQGGVARSKLSPALLDRLAGSPVTMRNWLTVQKLRELAEEGGEARAV